VAVSPHVISIVRRQPVKGKRDMSKKIFTKLFLGLLLVVVSLNSFSNRAIAQQRKIPKDPFHVVDASTGKQITEILVIARYSTFEGVSTMLGEGPSSGTYRNYLDKPFVYRTGEPFILKRPKSTGVNAGFLFAGKGRSLNGVLIVAPKYRPIWFDNLWQTRDIWNTRDIRDLKLTPLPVNEWSTLLEKELSPFVKGASRINDSCGFWDLPEKCSLEIYYGEKERELVRSFLQQIRTETT
jgi:hypothetical protein